MKRRIFSIIVTGFLLVTATAATAAKNYQIVAGAGPSTKIVQSFFDEFSKLPATDGLIFEVPAKSAKHAGGIKCSHYNFFGRTGRPLNAEEREMNKGEIFLARVPIAFIIGQEAGIDTISLENLEKVFTGQITNWRDLGGSDANIVLVGREPTEALFMELKKSYDFFNQSKFDAIVHKDDHVLNFIKSPQGKFGLAFGAKPNFSEFKTVEVEGFSAGVRLGLVYDLKNGDHTVIKAAQEYADSKAWKTLVVQQGMLPSS